MDGDVAQHRLALRHAFLRIALAEQMSRSGLMPFGIEHKARAGLIEVEHRRADGPAGEHARELGDVRLRVAAVHAQRMQLQDLAREILVQVPGCRKRRAPARAQPPRLPALAHREVVVEVEDHRRVTGRGQQHVGEVPAYVRPYGLAFEAADERKHQRLFRRHREMVRPEPDQALPERRRRRSRRGEPSRRHSSCMIGPSCSRNVPSTVRGAASDPSLDGVACLSRGLRSSADRPSGPPRSWRACRTPGWAAQRLLICLVEPAPRVGGSGGEFAWRGAQAEAIDRDDGFDAHGPFNGPEWKFLLQARRKRSRRKTADRTLNSDSIRQVT